MAPLNDLQQQLLASLGVVSGTVSLIGSVILIRMALMAQRRKATYNRLLIGLSFMDIVHAVSWGLQPILIPKSDDRVWSLGNKQTCTVAGFFVQLGSSVFLYNGALTMYFLVTIVFGVSEKKATQYAEPWLHGVPIGYPLITAIVGACIGLYSSLQLGSLCWIGEYPQGCEDDEETECISTILAWIYTGVPAMGTLIFLVVANIVIYLKVRKTMGRTRRFSMSSTNSATRHRADKQVAVQSTLYVMACIMTLVWSVMLRTLESMGVHRENESDVILLLFLGQFFYPLQGFWNFLIYLRPRYLRWRRREPEQPRWWCFRQALNPDAMMNFSTMSGAGASASLGGSSPRERPTSLHLSRKSHSDDGEETAVSPFGQFG